MFCDYRRVVIVLEVSIVASASQAGGKIGNPIALPLGGSTNGQQSAAAAQRQHTQIRQPAGRLTKRMVINLMKGSFRV